MSNHTSHRKWIVLVLLFLLMGIAACGPKSSPQAVMASSSDKPIGISTTPEPGNDGKPTPRSDGHTQSIVAASGMVYIGSDNGTLYAVSSSDGVVRWQQTLGSFVTVSAVIDSTVYVSTTETISAFDAASGARRWEHVLSDQIVNPTMMVADGMLFVSATVSHNNNSHAIYALRATDGSQLWRYTTPSVTPVLSGVVNGVVYSMEVIGDFVKGDQYAVALRTSDGHLLWRAHLGSTNGLVYGAPIESNGVVYIIDGDAIYALRVATGAIVWHVGAPVEHVPSVGAMPVALADGVIYANTHQGVLALRASDGVTLWEKKSTFSPSPSLLQPVVSNGHVYVASNSGAIYALRTQDGSQIWQYAKTPISDPFTIENGLVYINAPDQVYALNGQNGALAWQQSLEHHNAFSNNDTSMLIADNIMYVSNDNGIVQAFRARDGKLLWSYTIQEQAVPTDLVYTASVTFASSVSYQQALKIIADLGLKLSLSCPSLWKPQVNGDIFSSHSLLVEANVNAAPLWLNRLKATAGVQDAQAVGVHSCPMERVDDDFSRLHLQQSGAFVQVTFSPTMSYGAALETISNLWFRVADPCYEQARAQGAKPTWYSQGQATTFAKTHSFILATTALNSIHWLDQLHAAAGVMKVDAPFKVACSS